MRSSDDGTIHIIGAGLAGLAAAVQLAQSGRAVVVHEATAHMGGRCRSYYDSNTDMVIDCPLSKPSDPNWGCKVRRKRNSLLLTG